MKVFINPSKRTNFFIGFGLNTGQVNSQISISTPYEYFDQNTGNNRIDYVYSIKSKTSNFYDLSGLVGLEVNPIERLALEFGVKLSGRTHALPEQYWNGSSNTPIYRRSELIVRPILRLRLNI